MKDTELDVIQGVYLAGIKRKELEVHRLWKGKVTELNGECINICNEALEYFKHDDDVLDALSRTIIQQIQEKWQEKINLLLRTA